MLENWPSEAALSRCRQPPIPLWAKADSPSEVSMGTAPDSGCTYPDRSTLRDDASDYQSPAFTP